MPSKGPTCDASSTQHPPAAGPAVGELLPQDAIVGPEHANERAHKGERSLVGPRYSILFRNGSARPLPATGHSLQAALERFPDPGDIWCIRGGGQSLMRQACKGVTGGGRQLKHATVTQYGIVSTSVVASTENLAESDERRRSPAHESLRTSAPCGVLGGATTTSPGPTSVTVWFAPSPTVKATLPSAM